MPCQFVFLGVENTDHSLRPKRKDPFQNIVEQGENAGNQHFLLFPQCFLPQERQLKCFQVQKDYRLQMLSNWTMPTSCLLVKG